ncbi:MAG: penicillin acylase family protein, partial [Rhodospirillales bacterium]|nr:penicillin acylase family protein [Rhodospirillales bacterium]
MSDPALEAATNVYFDDDAVPYIDAQNFKDAAFALGYVHAQNRMWQMEMQRRLGAGRLSEILGAATLETDRFFRILGLYRLADESFAGLPSGVRGHLQAYAKGVNAWINANKNALPPEFLAFRHRPEPWRAADSLVWGKLMALRLTGNYRDELLRLRLLERLSAERIDELWPGYPTDAPITAAAFDQTGITESSRDPLSGQLLGPGPAPLGASNAWAVAGGHTDTGGPILANDPHLGFAAPILWYLAKIKLPGETITGATVPGVPYVIAGHNSRIAWGLTATQSDLQDIFIENLTADRPGYYDTPDGPAPFQVREEAIGVRGASAIPLKIYATRHGPVISPVRPGASTALALSASFLTAEDRTSEALHNLNLARDRDDFLSALSAMNAFQLNFTYADSDGSIGFYAAGKVPIRKKGIGFFPRPGAGGKFDWAGSIPFKQLPHYFDPAAGFIANANNPVAAKDYPYFISRDWAAPYRARRIDGLIKGSIRAGTPVTVEFAAAMQADNLSLMSRDLIGPMTDFEAPAGRLRQAVALLKGWDGHM